VRRRANTCSGAEKPKIIAALFAHLTAHLHRERAAVNGGREKRPRAVAWLTGRATPRSTLISG
jgi:hypothetical protein